MSNTQAQKAIEARIKKDGLRMSKQIHSGGLFSTPTYDRRTVYSLKDLYRLSSEGFHVTDDLGVFLFNTLMGAS